MTNNGAVFLTTGIAKGLQRAKCTRVIDGGNKDSLRPATPQVAACKCQRVS